MGDAREKFTIGQRVQMTERALEQGVNGRRAAPVFGTVTGFSRAAHLVNVTLDGTITPNRYHVDFWAPSPAPGTREGGDPT